MRLWHQDLISYLPRQQLLGQHRECCALRGAGWGRPHATVNYVFKHDPYLLVAYHYLVMEEMERRGYHPDPIWKNTNYRGKNIGEQKGWAYDSFVNVEVKYVKEYKGKIYSEHDDKYLKECIDNLKNKGIEINMEE